MEIWQLLLLAGTGAVAGFVNVMAGGGSLLTLPAMILIGMEGPVVNGTNRIGIGIQNISAVIGFFRRGMSDFKVSVTLSLCALPGAAVGAYFGTKLTGVWFNRVLAGVMVLVMILMAIHKKTSRGTPTIVTPSRKRVVVAHLLMILAGLYGGFIQAGVGFIVIAILHKVLGFDLVRVNMHKVFIIGTYTIVALSIFICRGMVAWLPGLCLAAGSSVGAWISTYFSVKKGQGLIRVVLNIALAALIIKLLLR